jgi:hypothetical protein
MASSDGPGTRETTRTSRLGRAVQNLFPGYFALVMATGIVSIAADLFSFTWIATALLWINVSAYAILGTLLLLRVVVYPRAVYADLRDHGRGAGFFTVVAGTTVLGVQLLVVAGAPILARVLWFVGIALWVLVMYGFFTAVVVRDQKPSLEAGITRRRRTWSGLDSRAPQQPGGQIETLDVQREPGVEAQAGERAGLDGDQSVEALDQVRVRPVGAMRLERGAERVVEGGLVSCGHRAGERPQRAQAIHVGTGSEVARVVHRLADLDVVGVVAGIEDVVAELVAAVGHAMGDVVTVAGRARALLVAIPVDDAGRRVGGVLGLRLGRDRIRRRGWR